MQTTDHYTPESGSLAPRKRADASPRIRDAQARALQPLTNRIMGPERSSPSTKHSMSRVSEGDELATSFGNSTPCDDAATRPQPARKSGSVGCGFNLPLHQTQTHGTSPARLSGSFIVAEHDLDKLLPGALRGFRPDSDTHASEASNPPGVDGADISTSGPASARTLLSGKSTARTMEIDEEVRQPGSVERRCSDTKFLNTDNLS